MIGLGRGKLNNGKGEAMANGSKNSRGFDKGPRR